MTREIVQDAVFNKGARTLAIVVAAIMVVDGATAFGQTREIQARAADVVAREVVKTRLGGCVNEDLAKQQLASFIQPYRNALTQAARKFAMSGFVDPSQQSTIGVIKANSASIDVTDNGQAVGQATIAWQLQNNSISLTVKGPIGSTDNPVFTDSGLTNGSSLSVGLAHTFWSSSAQVTPQVNALTQSLTTSCASASQSVLRTDRDRLALALALADAGEPGLLAVKPSAVSGARDLAKFAVATGAMTVTKALTANVNYGANRQKFTFITDSDLTPQPKVERGNEFSIGAGFAASQTVENGDGKTYQWPQYSVAAGFQHTTAFAASASRQICVPFGTTGATGCQSFHVGPPDGQTSNGFILDARQWSYGDKIGTDFQYFRDTDAKTNLVEGRLSYLRLKDSGLGAGLPSYLLDTEALSIGARAGYRWGNKATEGPYFVVYFATSLGSFSY